MEKTLRLSADQREDLVAYLDGELPDGKAQQIDQVLARSEVAWHEVEALARTWEMLDVLPTPKAPPEFTARTMTTLKVAETPFDITEQAWFMPLKRVALVVIWMVALGLSGWGGFRITNEWVGNSSRQMLEDLPTLQRLDLYQEVESTDFLDRLQKGRLFDDVPESGHAATDAKPVTAKSLTERHNQIAKMSKVERDRLQRNLAAFQQMSPEMQGHYRTLNEKLDEDRKEGGHLSSLLQTYSAWLQTLTPGQREELRQGTDRLALVHKFKEEQYHRVDPTPVEVVTFDPPRPFQGGPRPLLQPELIAVMRVLVAELPTEEQEKFSRLNRPEQYVEVLHLNIQHASHPRSWPSLELQDKILNVLPPRDRFIKRNPATQRATIVWLIHRSVANQVFESIRSKLPNESDSKQILSELDEKQRAELARKNPEGLRNELNRRHLEKHDPKAFSHMKELLSGLNRVMSEVGLPESPPRGMDDRMRPGEPPGPPPPRDGRSDRAPDRPPPDRPPPERPRRDSKDGNRKPNE